MAKVILFGGGDGGGIVIGPDGVQPIPPFDPSLVKQLRAINQLAWAMRTAKSSERSLIKYTGKLTGVVLKQIERIVGEIDAENGLVFQSDDGGFTCGSTGKPPIPFPFPVDPRVTVSSLLDKGILNSATIQFFEKASTKKIDIFKAARDPINTARKIGLELTPEIESNLAELNLEKNSPSDDTGKEVIKLYKKVVTDGRYISEWVRNPKIVADKLKVSVSEEAIAQIVNIRDQGMLGGFNPGTVMSPYAVAVVVAIVIVVWTREFELPVKDYSGIANKL